MYYNGKRNKKNTVMMASSIMKWFYGTGIVNFCQTYNLKPFEVVVPADMKCQWALAGRGMGCKTNVNSFFCIYCNSTVSTLKSPRPIRCSLCDDMYTDTNVECHHIPLQDSNYLDMCRQQMSSIKNFFDDNYDISLISDTTMEQDHLRLLGAGNDDDCSISWDYKNCQTRNRTSNFRKNVYFDLRRRGLHDGNLSFEEQVELLKSCFEAEASFLKLKNILSHMTNSNSLVPTECLIPCILHLENRVSEKILKEFFLFSFQKLCSNRLEDSYSEISLFINNVQEFVNKIILKKERNNGSVEYGTWTFPVEYNINFEDSFSGYKFTKTSLTNKRARLFIDSFSGFLECLPILTEDEKEMWVSLTTRYRVSMNILRQKEDYTDDTIIEFQKNIDVMYKLMIRISGLSFITNYIHLLGSGHITYFMYKYKNMYRYSNQGWESLNSLIKVFYFRRTNRGSTSSHIEPIVNFFLRKIGWICFSDEIENIKSFGEKEQAMIMNHGMKLIQIDNSNDNSIGLDDQNLQNNQNEQEGICVHDLLQNEINKVQQQMTSHDNVTNEADELECYEDDLAGI